MRSHSNPSEESLVATECCDSSCCSEDVQAPAHETDTKLADDVDAAEIRNSVRDYYASIAAAEPSACGCGCGCGSSSDDLEQYAKSLGYSRDELREVPEGANLGLGCGNPTALDSLTEGSVVLDLGSGGGFDCFLAASKVGEEGRVIGVDMTPAMIDLARRNAQKAGFPNVEFRLGEIEALPVADSSVDVVISNCVINLSPEKERVFAEAFRVLKPGGKLMVTDLVLTRELPDSIRKSAAAYAACVSGADLKEDYLNRVTAAGFEGVRAAGESAFAGLPFEDDQFDWLPSHLRAEAGTLSRGLWPVVSLQVTATKPLE